jgi:hypothetical protein
MRRSLLSAAQQDVYLNGFVLEKTMSSQKLARARGLRPLYVFHGSGHLDVVECDLKRDPTRDAFRVISTGAFVEHGEWRQYGNTVEVKLPCSRFPLPPNAKLCRPPESYVFEKTGRQTIGRLGEGLIPIVHPNMQLGATPRLGNFGRLRALLENSHTDIRR